MPDSTLTPEQTQALLTQLLSDGKTPPAKLGDLELVRDPTTQQPIAYRDPNTGNTISIPQPTATSRTPSPTSALDRIDAQGRVIPPDDTTTRPAKLRDPATGTVTDLPDPKTNAQPSGTFTNIVDPRDPAGKRIIGVVDTGDNSYHQLPAEPDPTTGRQIVNTGTKLLAVDKDNNVTTLATVDKQSPFQAVTINGKVYRFDPNETDAAKAFTPMGDQTPPDTRDANNNPMTWDKTQGKYVYPAGIDVKKPAAAVYGTGANDKYRITVDDQGNVVSTVPNENYQQPTPTQLTPDTAAPYVPMWDPTKNQVTWTPNRNQVTASDAVKQLAQQLGVQLGNGQISEKSAQDLITDAITAMNAHTAQVQAQTQQQQQVATTANTALSNINQSAQTGAGVLQNRVTAGTSMLNSVLGLAGQGQRSGNMGGGLMSVPAGLGDQLVGGITDWATQLGGGSDVYNSAANLVRRADPNNGLGQDASTAYGILGQMLQKYRDLTGTPHPAEAIAAQPQQQLNTGFNAPQTLQPTPQQLANQQAAAQQTAAATQQFGAPFGALGANRMPSTPVPQPAMPLGAIGSNPMLNAMQNQAFTAPQTFQTPVSPAPPKVTVSVG
jgi:hypothetical protein